MVARHNGYALVGDMPTKDKPRKTGYFDDDIKKPGAWADSAYRLSPSDPDAQTELAISAFLREVSHVVGVVRTDLDTNCTSFQQTIRVIVSDLLSQEAREISEIRSRILKGYPDAKIDIDIDEPDAQ